MILWMILLTLFSLLYQSTAILPATNPSIQRPKPLYNITYGSPTNASLHFDPPTELEFHEEVDENHALNLGNAKLVEPERDYYAAVVAAQNTNWGNFLAGGGDLRIYQKTVEFRRFGVRIYFDNPAKALSYDLVGDMLEALASFMWKHQKTEARFSLIAMGEGRASISNGGIERNWGP